MIVGKAVNLAHDMNVELLGLVENMAYFECPDCGKRHAIFGESHLDEVAQQLEVPILARLPMDPTVAAAFDAGKMESLETNYLADVAEKLDV